MDCGSKCGDLFFTKNSNLSANLHWNSSQTQWNSFSGCPYPDFLHPPPLPNRNFKQMQAKQAKLLWAYWCRISQKNTIIVMVCSIWSFMKRSAACNGNRIIATSVLFKKQRWKHIESIDLVMKNYASLTATQLSLRISKSQNSNPFSVLFCRYQAQPPMTPPTRKSCCTWAPYPCFAWPCLPVARYGADSWHATELTQSLCPCRLHD